MPAGALTAAVACRNAERPDRRGLEPAAGTCRDATGMARQDRDNPSKTRGFKPVKLQLWLANREEEWGKKKWR